MQFSQAASSLSVGDVAQLTLRIVDVSLYYLDLVRQSFCWGVGARQFYSSGWLARYRLLNAEEKERLDRIQRLTRKTWKEALHWAEGNISRGMLLMGAGFFGTVDALHRMKWVHAGPSAEAFAHTAGIMFVSAHILSVYYCVKDLKAANKVLMDPGLDQEAKKEASHLYRSAMFGLLSSIGYLFASAVTLLGAPAGLALVFGALASVTGGIETLQEYWQKKQPPQECQVEHLNNCIDIPSSSLGDLLSQ